MFSFIDVHKETCAVRRRREEPCDVQITNKEWCELYVSTSSLNSITTANKYLRFFMRRFGPHYFEQGAMKAISIFCNSLGFLHTTEELWFEDKKGNPVKRPYAFVSDFEQFRQTIREGRGIEEGREKLVISSDFGMGCLVITCAIYDLDEDGEMKPGSQDRIFLLGKHIYLHVSSTHTHTLYI